MSSTHLDGRTFKEASVPRANLTNCARTVGTSLSPKCRSQAAWQRWGRQEAKTSFQRPARAALESVQAWSCLSPLSGEGRLQMQAGWGRWLLHWSSTGSSGFRGGRPAHTEKEGCPENSWQAWGSQMRPPGTEELYSESVFWGPE